MAGKHEVLADLLVEGKITSTSVPNKTGVPLIWNLDSGDISHRTVAEFIEDYNLEVKGHIHYAGDGSIDLWGGDLANDARGFDYPYGFSHSGTGGTWGYQDTPLGSNYGGKITIKNTGYDVFQFLYSREGDAKLWWRHLNDIDTPVWHEFWHSGNSRSDAENEALFLQSYTETDPTVPQHVKDITEQLITNWNTSFGWGDHRDFGLETAVNITNQDMNNVTDTGFYYGETYNGADTSSSATVRSEPWFYMVMGSSSHTFQIAYERRVNLGDGRAARKYRQQVNGVWGAWIDMIIDSSDVENAVAGLTYSWNSITNKPTEFNPTSHTHPWTEVTGKPTTFPPSTHNHDDRYYTETEVDNKLSGKSNTGHTHSYSEITGKPTIPSSTSELTNDSGFITGLSWAELSGKPTEFNPTSHTHSWSQITGVPTFDNYQSWNLKTNGVQRTTVQSGGDLDLIAGSNVSLSYSAGGGVTISSSYVNTTYSNMSLTELTTGTVTTARTISAKTLTDWITAKGFITGVSWSQVTGKPTTFTPSAHTHSWSEITSKPSIPTKTSDLTNDSGFITIEDVPSGGGGVSDVVNKSGATLSLTAPTGEWLNFTGSNQTMVVGGASFSKNDEVEGSNTGSTLLTISPASGYTQIIPSGFLPQISTGGVFGIKFLTATSYMLFGALEAEDVTAPEEHWSIPVVNAYEERVLADYGVMEDKEALIEFLKQ